MVELSLVELGNISDKARQSWEYFWFGRKAKPGTLCAMVGWDGWHAYELDNGEISIVDEGGVDVTTFSDKSEFVRWLEECTDERAEAIAE